MPQESRRGTGRKRGGGGERTGTWRVSRRAEIRREDGRGERGRDKGGQRKTGGLGSDPRGGCPASPGPSHSMTRAVPGQGWRRVPRVLGGPWRPHKSPRTAPEHQSQGHQCAGREGGWGPGKWGWLCSEPFPFRRRESPSPPFLPIGWEQGQGHQAPSDSCMLTGDPSGEPVASNSGSVSHLPP